jgi:flagellar biosynthesis protein FlhA
MNLLQRVSKQSDILMAVLILTILAMLIVPVPEFLLDTMLVINLAAAVMVLITTLYNSQPLQFSAFPSLLLVTTLFRLSLNVAATKLILTTGKAGAVIDAFGHFVVGSNFIVGVIAFLILVVVQFIVITKGGERVAEVAARFALDALPGKQIAIDGELNAGMIDEKQAKERRLAVQREADFYGAMDGASKFVRGDAIAAIMIIIINVIGGFALGLSRGEQVFDVLQRYTLLTIGEGLVSQMPALLISTATGLLVTRSASDRPLGEEFSTQLFSRPRVLWIVAGFLLCLLILPGFPKPQLLLGACCAGGGAFALTNSQKRKAAIDKHAEDQALAESSVKPAGPESVMELLGVETIKLELGSNLVPLALPSEGGDLADRVAGVRKQIAMELGIVMPTVRIKDNLQLRANTYQVEIKGAVLASHELQMNCVLALDSGMTYQKFEGVETIEPALGTPAIWIAKVLKDRAEMAGYITVDPGTVLITHLTEIIKGHAHEMLTRQETQKLIDHVKLHDEAVVNELFPNIMRVGEVQKVLQALLKERVGIRDLTTILETLADYAPRSKDMDALSEFARQSLSRQICKQHMEEDNMLRCITLAPSLEQTLRESVQATATGNMLAIEPQLAQSMIRAMNEQLELAADQGYNPVLLCSGQIRLPMKRLIERSIPNLPVLAYTEIVPKVEVESLGTVEVTLALAAA